LQGYKTYYGYTYNVNYKEDWTHDDSTSSGYPMEVFLSPTGLSSVNIITESLPISYNIEQYKNASLQSLKNTYATSAFDEEKITVNGYDAYRISYSATRNGMTLDIKQTLLVSGRNAYVITFSGTDEDAETIYHNMENSFVMK